MLSSSYFIPIFFLFFFFHCTFQQSFTAFSDKTGKISSIVLTSGNIVAFVNAANQEYAQQITTEGTLNGSCVSILTDSHSLPSIFLPHASGGFVMFLMLDALDSNGFISYLNIYDNDLTTSLFKTIVGSELSAKTAYFLVING